MAWGAVGLLFAEQTQIRFSRNDPLAYADICFFFFCRSFFPEDKKKKSTCELIEKKQNPLELIHYSYRTGK